MGIKATLLALVKIQIDGGTQARAAINDDAVQEYADLLAGDNGLPPITVFYDGVKYWLADGFHRFLGARRADLAKIECDIRQGTQRDAVLFAVGANQAHGLKRTNADKRKAVAMLLADAEWSKQSDRWIAECAGVGADMVGDLRRQLSESDSSSDNGKRTGKDGKARSLPKKKETEPASTTDVAPEVVADEPEQGDAAEPEPEAGTDQLGRKIPPQLTEAFAAIPAMRKAQSDLHRIKREVLALRERPGADRIHRQSFEASIKNAVEAIIRSEPYTTCPYCKASGKDCEACGKRGWVFKGIYDQAPREMK